MKRFCDIILSFLGLVILSPLLLILSLITVCTSKGGVFFRGERVGRHGKPFKIFKFRSMVKDAEGHGKWNIGENDPRITKWGHFLRKTKLDELPQLINVFIGNMAMVGPRPELQVYVDMYTEKEKPILDLRPGITDWASMVNIAQYKDFTAAKDPDQAYLQVIRPLKLRLQLYYRYHRNLWMDLRILNWTVLKVIFRFKKLPKKVQAIVDDYNKEYHAQHPEEQH
jgi:lipopolysaccharide/colanic/teichoic acid biosynthesis glycosyltransferase